MNDNELKNKMLATYSKNFGNNEVGLIKIALENGITDYKLYLDEFKNLKNKIYDYFWKLTENGERLQTQEIDSLSKIYCANNYAWINDKGLKALLDWLQWMCWHEGISK